MKDILKKINQDALIEDYKKYQKWRKIAR